MPCEDGVPDCAWEPGWLPLERAAVTKHWLVGPAPIELPGAFEDLGAPSYTSRMKNCIGLGICILKRNSGYFSL